METQIALRSELTWYDSWLPMVARTGFLASTVIRRPWPTPFVRYSVVKVRCPRRARDAVALGPWTVGACRPRCRYSCAAGPFRGGATTYTAVSSPSTREHDEMTALLPRPEQQPTAADPGLGIDEHSRVGDRFLIHVHPALLHEPASRALGGREVAVHEEREQLDAPLGAG